MKYVLFLLVIILCLSYGFLKLFSKTTIDTPIFVIAPLPQFLELIHNQQVSTLSLWLPQKAQAEKPVDAPNISAKSGLVFDLTTQKMLYLKNPYERLPMASLTKIMTAVISLENKRTDDRYTVLEKDLVGEDSMGLATGEILSSEELLYGLMLNSGNDAAEVLADSSSLGREKFIQAMNNKTKALGLSDTYFTNPTGLEGDGNQYITSYDLLVITRYALSHFPLFNKIVATAYYVIEQTRTHKVYYLENQTNLLTSYPGVMGVKTGYTPEAGLCLVTYIHYKNHDIIGNLLGSSDRRGEMKELLDYSLKTIGITPPPHG